MFSAVRRGGIFPTDPNTVLLRAVAVARTGHSRGAFRQSSFGWNGIPPGSFGCLGPWKEGSHAAHKSAAGKSGTPPAVVSCPVQEPKRNWKPPGRRRAGRPGPHRSRTKAGQTARTGFPRFVRKAPLPSARSCKGTQTFPAEGMRFHRASPAPHGLPRTGIEARRTIQPEAQEEAPSAQMRWPALQLWRCSDSGPEALVSWLENAARNLSAQVQSLMKSHYL